MRANLGTGRAYGFAIVAAAVVCCAGSAEAGEGRAQAETTLLVTIGAFEEDGPGHVEAEPVLARGALSITGDYLFDNQIEVGGGLLVAAERDHPVHAPRGGVAGDCPPTAAQCPGAGLGGLRGYFSGYADTGRPFNEDARASLEAAYVYLRGGWGEISAGRDEGVASLFSPAIGGPASVIDPALDPTGLGGVHVRNDISGRSAKVSVRSQRILGVSLGASYTPELEHKGLDQGFKVRPDGPLAFDPENIVEAGVSFSQSLRGTGVMLSATAATAEPAKPSPALEDLRAYGLSASFERGEFRVAGAYLWSNNGFQPSDEPYRAAAISAAWTRGEWGLVAEAGRSSDDLVDVDLDAARVGVEKRFAGGVEIALSASWTKRNSPVANGVERLEAQDEALGLVSSLFVRR